MQIYNSSNASQITKKMDAINLSNFIFTDPIQGGERKVQKIFFLKKKKRKRKSTPPTLVTSLVILFTLGEIQIPSITRPVFSLRVPWRYQL